MRHGTFTSSLLCLIGLSAMSAGVVTPVLSAADRILTIGGGYSPYGNQVSLEKNVLYFQRVLPLIGCEKTPHHILFADGTDPAPDLVIDDPELAASEDWHLVAAILGSTKGIDENFRSNLVADAAGPSTVKEIDAWFEKQKDTWKDNDRLLIYYTGHGSGGGKKTPRNCKLNLWNGESYYVDKLVERLDELPESVSVVIVMVQCHSGGFADVIFEKGDSEKDLSKHSRCGFYATVPERTAAGCTSDIAEENYQEYSTFFWAALCGQTRTGKKIEVPDYNEDGIVSFEEAHAYVKIASDTIDIPIATTDVFLRRFAKLPEETTDDTVLTLDSTYDRLLAEATPAQRAVLEGLSAELDLKGDKRVADAKKLKEKAESDMKSATRKAGEKGKERGVVRGKIAKSIKTRWPETRNPFHPKVHELLKQKENVIAKAIKEHESFDEYEKLTDEYRKASEDKLNYNRRVAKITRFVRVAENIVLTHQIMHGEDEEIRTAFTSLRNREQEHLGKAVK